MSQSKTNPKSRILRIRLNLSKTSRPKRETKEKWRRLIKQRSLIKQKRKPTKKTILSRTSRKYLATACSRLRRESKIRVLSEFFVRIRHPLSANFRFLYLVQQCDHLRCIIRTLA